MIVALGIGCDGRKTVLGLREGATENAAVVSGLLSDLAGARAGLQRAAAVHAGRRQSAGSGGAPACRRGGLHPALPGAQEAQCAWITCPKNTKPTVKKKLQNAYAMIDYADAKRALERLHRELMDLNPSAARSLEEGMEETLTVHKLRVPDQLRRTLVLHQRDRVGLLDRGDGLPERETLAARRSDRTLGWLRACWWPSGSSARCIGHRQIPLLLSSMANAVSKKSIAKGAAVA